MPTVVAGTPEGRPGGYAAASPLGTESLAVGGLSEELGPFLPHFARETVRCGGSSELVREDGRLVGLVLTDPLENAVSVFTRSATLVRRTLHENAGRLVYAEVDVDAPREVFLLYAAGLAEEPAHRFRHPVELLGERDDAAVRALVEETHGRLGRPWPLPPSTGPDSRFGVRVGPDLVGVAWLTLAGRSSRLHTLGVRAGYRRLGIGTDLLFARLLWAWRAGAARVVSEIAEENLASRAIAERGGMRPVGRGFLYRAAADGRYVERPPEPENRFDYVRFAPQNGQLVAVESMSEPQ